MGGKHKQQAQRTKNNARPSSSGRSAEMLGASIPQFVGFSTLKESSLLLPALNLATSDASDSQLDTNFQLVLKKMNKKDSTTKLKALQEFAELVKSAEAEALKAVLAFWPRLYSALATDVEHRVREAAHVAHLEVVLKVKRNLAPVLKQLVGPWFTAQYDNYPPAASAASRAFEAAFPPNKIQEVIIFCEEEILNYICDNLTVQTVETLSNTKIVSMEEAEAKYERVVLASLQGYSLYLSKISAEQVKKSEDLNLKIVRHQNFWKLAKHKAAVIQAAFFEVLSNIGQHAPFLYEAEKSLVVNTVFGNLDKGDALVLPKIWESVLSLTSNVANWWEFINVEKVFVTKLVKILREGGKGNAVAIYPYLLPLLSNLPPSIDKNTFLNNFFDSMKTGLKNKNVLASRSESLAITTAYIECLKYVILQNKSEIVLCEKLIRSHLITLLEWGLTDGQACHKPIFNQVTALIQYWNRNQSNVENYSVFVYNFWSNLESLLLGVLMNLEVKNDMRGISELAVKQIELLQCLKHTVKQKKQTKVKFVNDDVQDLDGSSGDKVSRDCDSTYLGALDHVVSKTCEAYLRLINEKRCKDLIEHLCCLLNDFDAKKIFEFLIRQFDKGGDGPKSLVVVYKNVLYKWLKCSYLCSKPVVDLVFLLFRFLQEEEKAEILDTLENVKEDCMGWCIAQALSHPHSEDLLIQKWLRNDHVSKFISEIVDKELADECPPELGVILKLVFTENSNGELFISSGAVKEIVSKLKLPLLNPNEYSLTIDTCASLAAYISAVLYSEKNCLTYGDDLLLALFALTCNTNTDQEYLTKDTVWEVSTAWQDALTSIALEMPKSDFKTLISKLASVLEHEVTSCEVSSLDSKDITEILLNLTRCCHKSVPILTGEVLTLFFELEFVQSSRSSTLETCKWAEFITGHLSSPFCEVKCPDSVTENDVARFILMARVFGDVLSSSLEAKEEDYEDDEGYPGDENERVVLEVLDGQEEVLGRLLHDFAMMSSYLKNYGMLKYTDRIEEHRKHMQENLSQIFSKITDDIKTKLFNYLTEKVQIEHWLWCTAVYLLYTELCPSSVSVAYEKLSIKVSDLGLLHLTQIFANHLGYEHIRSSKFGDIEHIILLRCFVSYQDDLEVQIAENFTRIQKIRSVNTREFFCDGSAFVWEVMQKGTEIIRCFAALVRHKSNLLSRQQWDSAVVLLLTWSENVLKLRARFEDTQCIAILSALADFFFAVTTHIECLRLEESSSFVSEWDDLFAQNVHLDMFQLWYFIFEKYAAGKHTLTKDISFLREFSKITSNLDHTHLFKEIHGFTKWSKFLKLCTSLLVSRSCVLQLQAHKMLIVLSPGLVHIDSASVKSSKPHEKGMILGHFTEVLVHTQEITQTMLDEFRLGEDSCRVQPFTDSYTYTFAYLLLWDVLLDLCDKASTELRYQYAEWLQNDDCLKNLLKNIFRLMPTEVLHSSDSKSKPHAELFLTKPKLQVGDSCTSETLEHLVCWVYTAVVTQLPALIRQWWSNTDSRTSQVVDRVTTAYVSPQLCSQEMATVAQEEGRFKNMVIKVHPVVREVIAVYTVDDSQMELVITLPPNYPLGLPDIQCSRQIGGTAHRQWLMQLKMCILHQNRRISDSLVLWNNNLNKKFDGVEECYVCFSILHPGTYQLPKLSCQTCKKKFHSACLYKWFSTSNKSTCPICRNLF